MGLPITRERVLLAAALIGATAGAAHADTMPQLQFSNPLLVSQVVWGAIIFAVFYFLVSRGGLPKLDAVLEKRAQTITAELESARRSKESADAAVTELTEARRRAFAESQAAIAAATTKAKAEAEVRATDVNARLDRQLAESEARIGQARAAAMASLQDLATDTAEAVFTRITGLGADKGRLAGAVSQILGERGQPGHNTAQMA